MIYDFSGAILVGALHLCSALICWCIVERDSAAVGSPDKQFGGTATYSKQLLPNQAYATAAVIADVAVGNALLQQLPVQGSAAEAGCKRSTIRHHPQCKRRRASHHPT